MPDEAYEIIVREKTSGFVVFKIPIPTDAYGSIEVHIAEGIPQEIKPKPVYKVDPNETSVVEFYAKREDQWDE
jgi:hypothetical protein